MALNKPSPIACQGAILSLLGNGIGSAFNREIVERLSTHFSLECIAGSLDSLESQGKIRSVLVLGEGTRYDLAEKPAFFCFRRITPLFAGTPEWIVETSENRLVCWCTREFDAQLITNALNGTKS
jgi:hypothetical protein